MPVCVSGICWGSTWFSDTLSFPILYFAYVIGWKLCHSSSFIGYSLNITSLMEYLWIYNLKIFVEKGNVNEARMRFIRIPLHCIRIILFGLTMLMFYEKNFFKKSFGITYEISDEINRVVLNISSSICFDFQSLMYKSNLKQRQKKIIVWELDNPLTNKYWRQNNSISKITFRLLTSASLRILNNQIIWLLCFSVNEYCRKLYFKFWILNNWFILWYWFFNLIINTSMLNI